MDVCGAGAAHSAVVTECGKLVGSNCNQLDP